MSDSCVAEAPLTEEELAEKGRQWERFNRLCAIDARRDQINRETDELKTEREALEEQLLPLFEKPGFKPPGAYGRKIQMRRDVRASAKGPVNIQTLKDNPLTSMFVKDSVHAGTLAAWVRKLAEDAGDPKGNPTDYIPPELKDAIKVSEMFSLRTLKA